MTCERTPADIPSELALAATYIREVRAGIERIWENVLDWEHLPALHEIYFNHVALIEIGGWGWRVELTKAGTADRRMLLELQIDRAKARYRVRTLAGEGTGTEIWTLLEPLGPQRTAIEVCFYLPEQRPERLAALGEKYRSSYARLWDQDEAMMVRREALLARSRTRSRVSGVSLRLGSLSELRLPLLVELDGEPFRILELEGGRARRSLDDLPALARAARRGRPGKRRAALPVARLSVRSADRGERRRAPVSIGPGTPCRH